MKLIWTLVFSMIFLGLNAQEPFTVIELSVDQQSCDQDVQYQFNIQVCEPADLQESEQVGLQNSIRDWSKFEGIDNEFECKTNLSQMGCRARFRLDEYALNKVLNISVVQVKGDNVNMMQIMVPVTKANNETIIDIRDIPFETKSVNLVNKMTDISSMAKGNVLMLQPIENAF